MAFLFSLQVTKRLFYILYNYISSSLKICFLFITLCYLKSFLEPSVGPDSVSASQMNKTTFNISWERLPRAKSFGKVILYEVKANLLWKSHFYNWSAHNNVTVNTSSTFVFLPGLLICSEYNVSVRAYTGAGPGPYGEPLELVTSEFDTDQHFMSTT